MIHQTIVLKRIGETWEGVITQGNRFERALPAGSLEDGVLKGIVPLLSKELPEGSIVAIDVAMESAEDVAQGRAIEEAAEAERRANAELAKLEAAKVARDKVKAAKEALKNG